jgi:Fe-S-cluster containining protein
VSQELNGDHPEEELTEEQREYIKKMIEKLMEKQILVVYGDEDNTEEITIFGDEERRHICGSICCSFTFALTKRDVEEGFARWNPKRPYFIAREADGYCPHLDRKTLLCTIWEHRPERCRKYDCRNDNTVWIDWEKKIINQNIFGHLPGSEPLRANDQVGEEEIEKKANKE